MAATTGPTPKILVVVVREAATTAAKRSLSSFSWPSTRRWSPRSSVASSTRAAATAPAGSRASSRRATLVAQISPAWKVAPTRRRAEIDHAGTVLVNHVAAKAP